jgi:hypothetical protein
VTADDHFPLELVRALRAVPSYYLRYYYAPDEVLPSSWTARAARPT